MRQFTAFLLTGWVLRNQFTSGEKIDPTERPPMAENSPPGDQGNFNLTKTRLRFGRPSRWRSVMVS